MSHSRKMQHPKHSKNFFNDVAKQTRKINNLSIFKRGGIKL